MPGGKGKHTGPATHYEDGWRARGCEVVAGVDEAGRGPLAGPVVAAAVVLPVGYSLPGIQDSKLLTPNTRQRLYESLVKEVSYAVGLQQPPAIDQLNILNATHAAMREAVHKLVPRPQHVLVDGLPIGDAGFSYTALVKGDRISLSIAAASIIAKVTRDGIMEQLDQQYPQYGFAKHKGYAARQHLSALEAHGPCVEHRFSFSPVRRACREAHRALLEERLGNRQLDLRMDS